MEAEGLLLVPDVGQCLAEIGLRPVTILRAPPGGHQIVEGLPPVGGTLPEPIIELAVVVDQLDPQVGYRVELVFVRILDRHQGSRCSMSSRTPAALSSRARTTRLPPSRAAPSPG